MELYSCELIKLSEMMPSRDSVHLIFFFLKALMSDYILRRKRKKCKDVILIPFKESIPERHS